MKISDCAGLEKELEKVMDSQRYRHTIGVAHTAAGLATVYGEDVGRAYVTGLLHDCSKGMKTSGQVALANELGIELSESEKRIPALIHAKTGAYLAKVKYGIKDEEMISAITYHTTGRPEMSLLEKIIYISDYIEPNRDKQPRLDLIRKMAYKEIDKALVMILEDTVGYLRSKDPESVDPMTEKTYKYYLKENS